MKNRWHLGRRLFGQKVGFLSITSSHGFSFWIDVLLGIAFEVGDCRWTQNVCFATWRMKVEITYTSGVPSHGGSGLRLLVGVYCAITIVVGYDQPANLSTRQQTSQAFSSSFLARNDLLFVARTESKTSQPRLPDFRHHHRHYQSANQR